MMNNARKSSQFEADGTLVLSRKFIAAINRKSSLSNTK